MPCEEDSKRIRQAIRQKQALLIRLEAHDTSIQAEHRKLKQAAAILLNPDRKEEYDNSIALELQPFEENKLPFLDDPELVGALPPLPQSHTSTPKKTAPRLSQDQIRLIGIACVLMILLFFVVIPFVWTSEDSTEDVASADAQEVVNASADIVPPVDSSLPQDATFPAKDQSEESVETARENDSTSDPPEDTASTPPFSETASTESGFPPATPAGNTNSEASPTSFPSNPLPSIRSPEVELLAEVDLPPLPNAESPTSKPVQIGQVNESARKDFSMRLDSGACNLDRLYRFELSRATPPESLSWRVQVVVDDSSSKALGVPANYRPIEEPIARFFIDANGSLQFEWSLSTRYPAAEQLRNARLLVSVANKTHIVALRKAVRSPSHVVSLENEVDENPIHLTALPASENIFLELTQTSNISLPVEISPDSRRIHPNEPMTVTLGAPQDTVKVQFRIALKRKEDDELSIAIVPRYFMNDRWSEFTKASVSSSVARVQRAIYDGKQEVNQSLSAIKALEDQISKLSNRQPANLQEAGAISRALDQARSQHKAHVSRVKRRSNQVPTSYVALAMLHRVAVLGQVLHNTAQLKYRVFAVGNTGEINLLVADSTPATSPAPEGFDLANRYSSPIGDWVLFSKPPMRYEFLSGGSLRVRNFLTNQETASGRWSQKETEITLEARGKQVVYEMKDGVEMRSDDGIGLFRQIDAP
ncbi:hypothetical protein [Blastopirellula marina]|uniref:Uncharacterized protein n=1 Tax=Blastopirellula marina TaxID=124 RepID=A0A2S8F7S2_9BACT|nr:hypothetical protein [Blastopirellula marina]PQO28209.1 hypothetical protein C5Y98_25250 [Blastopirellula marina]PTL41749.1 hypothetical protein C5Y97_25265 [Blastopirellula marina]